MHDQEVFLLESRTLAEAPMIFYSVELHFLIPFFLCTSLPPTHFSTSLQRGEIMDLILLLYSIAHSP